VSKGFLIFAENTKDVDYIQQAYALALSIQHSQTEIKSVSIMTNDKIPKKYQYVFDQIVPMPFKVEPTKSRYKPENRWQFYYATPYDETIVLDTDMLLLDDISDWWTYCADHDIKFCSRIKNYKHELVGEDKVHRLAFIENKLTNPYFACHYFKKNQTAYEFYKVLEFVITHWEFNRGTFAPNEPQLIPSMDLATAIAIEITGQYQSVIDDCSPLEFVHMKTSLQGWDMVHDTWQDAVPFLLNSRGDLVLGNIKQPKLFHYVEKSFMSKKILTRLESIVNGKTEITN
jgi:hypothetical protein